MLTVNLNQRPQNMDKVNLFTTLPVAFEVQSDSRLGKLLADLSPDNPWGERQIAAKKLGYMRNPEALPGLLNALLADTFWMVRCEIIQAVEMIGDPRAIPILEETATNDSFQVVRSYAATAIERLSR